MNLTNVDFYTQYDNSQLGVIFSGMVKQVKGLIRHAVTAKYPFRGNMEFDDYYQESLIYCWKSFLKDFYGYMHPSHKTEKEKLTWEGWFYQMASFGAMNYYRKLHKRRQLQYVNFFKLPEYFDPVEEGVEYDYTTDALINRMEALIDKMPTERREQIRAYIRSGCSYNGAAKELGEKVNNASLDELHWAVEIIRHKVILEVDKKARIEFEGLGLGGLLQYAADMFISTFNTPMRRDDTEFAFFNIIAAVKELGYDHLSLAEVNVLHFLDILDELKKEQDLQGRRPPIYKRRLTQIFDLLVDLGLLEKNILAGLDGYSDVKVAANKVKAAAIGKKRILRFRVASSENFRTRATPSSDGKIEYVPDQCSVQCISIDGDVVKHFPSIRSVMRDGFNLSGVARIIKTQRTNGLSGGHRWAVLDNYDPDHPLAKAIAKPLVRIIYCFAQTGEQLHRFVGTAEAIKAGFDENHIKMVADGKKAIYRGFNWAIRYEDANAHLLIPVQ